MRIRLGHNNITESRACVCCASRGKRDRGEIKELTLEILFEGDFDEVHIAGDNRKILPTDAIKNTVYVLAKRCPPEPIEEFAEHLDRALPHLQSASRARQNHRYRTSLEPHRNRRQASFHFVHSQRQRKDETPRSRERARKRTSRRASRISLCDEDRRLGIRRIHPRSLHHVERNQGSHSDEPCPRRVALCRGGNCLQSDLARRSPGAHRKHSPSIAAARCNTRFTPWARRC